MKLCASNIAWNYGHDEEVFGIMRDLGFNGLEVAPSRIFPDDPYSHIQEASEFAAKMRGDYGLCIASMQSIWYGMTQRISGNLQERRQLLEHTRRALRFADAMSCHNIVFGCPKNRRIDCPEDYDAVVKFLLDIADDADAFGITIALEPNPEIYGTNFVNTTAEAIELVSRLKHNALKVNLDFGTIIANGEELSEIPGNLPFISHIHISEPQLVPVKPRAEHEIFADILRDSGYSGFVSLEMRKTKSVTELERVMTYLSGVFR